MGRVNRCTDKFTAGNYKVVECETQTQERPITKTFIFEQPLDKFWPAIGLKQPEKGNEYNFSSIMMGNDGGAGYLDMFHVFKARLSGDTEASLPNSRSPESIGYFFERISDWCKSQLLRNVCDFETPGQLAGKMFDKKAAAEMADRLVGTAMAAMRPYNPNMRTAEKYELFTKPMPGKNITMPEHARALIDSAEILYGEPSQTEKLRVKAKGDVLMEPLVTAVAGSAPQSESARWKARGNLDRIEKDVRKVEDEKRRLADDVYKLYREINANIAGVGARSFSVQLDSSDFRELSVAMKACKEGSATQRDNCKIKKIDKKIGTLAEKLKKAETDFPDLAFREERTFVTSEARRVLTFECDTRGLDDCPWIGTEITIDALYHPAKK